MKKTLLLLAIFMVSFGSSTFAAANWPPTDEDYVFDWRVGPTPEVGWFIHYDGILYECLIAVKFDGTWWNPKDIITAPGYENHFIERGAAKRWIPCIGQINQGDYILDGNALYQCNTATNSGTWVPANFDRICDADLTAISGDPCDEPNILPANYVGYWYDNVQRWSPGWIGVDASTGLVYKCISLTNANGGESPTSQYGHWWSNGGAWNAPPVSLGSVENLLNIEGVTIPAWDDLRAWPMGAIVGHGGKYYFYTYNSSIIYTTKGAGQEPGTAAGDEFWVELALDEPLPNTVTQMAASKISPIVNPPQFIVIGSDDNTNADAFNWMIDVVTFGKPHSGANFDAGQNKDGSQRYMSFYTNTAGWNQDRQDAAKRAYDEGHTVGNHTASHVYCVAGDKNEIRMSDQEIYEEMLAASDAMIAAGIPKEHQYGFRTPFLTYSDSTFSAMKRLRFLYDCSINSLWGYGGLTPNNPANFPYTLDIMAGQQLDVRGNLPPDNNSWWGRGEDGAKIPNPIREHKGLWVIPASAIAVYPADRAAVASQGCPTYILGAGGTSGSGLVAGLDYNLWSEANMDEEQSLRALVYTVQQTVAGNRAPLHFGFHSQMYFPDDSGNSDPSFEQKRNMFEEFVKQASQIDDVFFVTADMVIAWMQNPCSADEFKPEDYWRKAVIPEYGEEILMSAQITPNTVIDENLPRPLNGTVTAIVGGERTIAGVTVDLSEVGGSASLALTFNGSNYEFEYQLPATLTIGVKTITFTVTDSEGDTKEQKLKLSITKQLETPDGSLIDDFEGTELVTKIGTPWLIDTDVWENEVPGQSTIDINIVPGGANGTANALQIDYELIKVAPKSPEWEPYVACMFSTTPDGGVRYNFACATGISFWHKGAKLAVRPVLSQIIADDTWAFHRADVPKHDDWTLVVLNWSDFKQPSNWGLPPSQLYVLAQNLQSIVEFQFLIEGADAVPYNATGTIWIDEIRISKDPACETGIDDVIATSGKTTVVATSETLSIYAQSPMAEVSLINIQGMTILTQKVQDDFAKISISSLPKGVYLAKIIYDDRKQPEIVKFIK